MTEIDQTQDAPDVGAVPDDDRNVEQLRKAAAELNVAGRTSMNREQLLAAVRAGELERTLAGELPPSTPEQVGRPPLTDVAEERAAELAAKTRVIGAPVDTNDLQEAPTA